MCAAGIFECVRWELESVVALFLRKVRLGNGARC